MELKITSHLGRNIIKAKDPKNRDIRSFDEWLELFLRYISVYGQMYPKEVPSIIDLHGSGEDPGQKPLQLQSL